MVKTSDKIEKGFRIPCGPMDVAADAICRRSLRDGTNTLLDRLTRETNSGIMKPQKIPSGLEVDEGGQLVDRPRETPDEKRSRLIEEGKLRAEVQMEVKKYREQILQGNSKLLQDISGRIEPH
jgi:hypothetical protein